ncbi:MAG: polyketide synthase dehydratase domain-containing protein [Desulfurivibrionaceae bacterium]
MTTWHTPVAIPVQPWFADHRFNGKVVLPAVETMLLLAAAVAGTHPEVDIRVMDNVRFARFLEIPEGSASVAALIEYREKENGSIHVKLLSRRQCKGMTRLQEHGEILFSPPQANPGNHGSTLAPVCPADPETRIPAEQVYRELVPFGPNYHTLQESLHLSGQSAWAKLKAPALRTSADSVRDSLGSPFPLDGAFHAACVLGQRLADFVPFPVGFGRRIILRPTQPGGSYRARVELLSLTRDELVFDLNIFDGTGQVYESVTGVRMRDVSGGRIKPPEWIKERNKKG